MENSQSTTPCLIQTKQGVSIEYQGKFLYSKYNPSKNIENYISSLQILPGTIFLINSPVMNYGINNLLYKLEKNCILIICEKDPNLRKLIDEYINTYNSNQAVFYPSLSELNNLPIIFNEKSYTFSDNKTIFSGFYKRIVRIDFSSGTQFFSDFYNELEIACINSIKTFWINRVTLTKFGRKYTKNFFRNYSILPFITPISNYFKSINKPIIVCGAGESLNSGIYDFINHRNDFYILAVDTSASFLIHNGIIPDGIFIEECQNIILKSFFDINKYPESQIFAGLSSINNLSHIITNLKNISFFFTEYTKADFFNCLKDNIFFPEAIPAFGSVGLTAVQFALMFRKSENIPIYIYGLDFSFSKGITHVKNSISNKDKLIKNNKLQKITNYSANYINSIKVSENLFTTITLSSYADLFVNYFSQEKNIFDSRDSGLNLHLIHKIPESIEFQKMQIINKAYSNDSLINIKSFFEKEIEQLQLLKSIFTNTNNENKIYSKDAINSKIEEILKSREYLYLHFIDGYQLSLNTDFLKRIRTEIDFFLKDFYMILNNIQNLV